MTGCVKTVYKTNESSGLTNTKNDKSEIKFLLIFIPAAVATLTCLILSIISVRLAFLTNNSMQDLHQEVLKLKATFDNTLLSKVSEFDSASYNANGYVNSFDSFNTLKQEMGNRNGHRSEVIGVMKYSVNDHATTIDPETRVAKLLANEKIKRRPRSMEPSVDMELIINATTDEFLDHPMGNIDTTTSRTVEPNKSKKRLTKRSTSNASSSNKLIKGSSRLHDSVEEFSVMAEPTTVPSKRSKGRTRHNIETLDERKKKIIVAVHFDGDSSGYVVGKHTNYNGNGHLSHPSQIYSDWVEANWVKANGMEEHFHLQKGIAAVKESGLYLIYAQIYYLDDHDTNGFRVYKNEESIMQCTTMTHSADRMLKGNTCFTSRVEFLKENDAISVRDLANMRYTIFEGGKSFFGLIKLK